MKREYANSPYSEDARFFVGKEIEHTKFFGKRTLFVVGVCSTIDVIQQARDNDCKHVFLGANHSWSVGAIPLLGVLLVDGFKVTVDCLPNEVDPLRELLQQFPDSFCVTIRIPLVAPHLLNNSVYLKVEGGLPSSESDPKNGVWLLPICRFLKKAQKTKLTKYLADVRIE